MKTLLIHDRAKLFFREFVNTLQQVFVVIKFPIFSFRNDFCGNFGSDTRNMSDMKHESTIDVQTGRCYMTKESKEFSRADYD
jgi:hypothetical protein